jgi:hypothetical protein
MGLIAKLLKISSAICFGVYVLAALAPLRDGEYVIIDGALLLADSDDDGDVSKRGSIQATALALAAAFVITGYAADHNQKR